MRSALLRAARPDRESASAAEHGAVGQSLLADASIYYVPNGDDYHIAELLRDNFQSVVPFGCVDVQDYIDRRVLAYKVRGAAILPRRAPHADEVETADNGFGNEYDAFVATASRTLASMERDPSRARRTSAEYGEHLCSLLEKEFSALLATLGRGRVVVNLPAFTRGLVHRVPEAIAAGRVVLTNRLDDRPKTMEWLEANPGVFLYDTPEQLKRALSSLIGNPAFVHKSACDAVVFTREAGSAEVRLADALVWIDRTAQSVESQIQVTSSECLLHAGSDG